MMQRRTFVWSVLLPLAALVALLAAISGCEQPAGFKRPRCNTKVVAFTASWCEPCQRAKPTLVQIQAAGVDVQIVDIDQHLELARQYNVTSVPTFLVFMCGKPAVRTSDVSVIVSLVK